MSPYTVSILSCLLLFGLIPVFAQLGHRAGRRTLSASADARELSTGTVDAAILSLLGLLTAFTFSSAYSRYELRRQLIVDEVNNIGTAYLRLDLLPADAQPEMRKKFREYTRSRFDFWQELPNREAALVEYAHTVAMQKEIWKSAIAATTDDRGDARKLLLPAINAMIDITTTRLIAVQSHPPLMIFLLLGGLSLVAAWVVGFGMAKTTTMSYSHVFGFAAMASLALYMILDIEFPRSGCVTLNSVHQLFVDLETSMH